MNKMESSQSMWRCYPIGTPGQPWGDAEKMQWLANAQIQRSYKDEVLDKLEDLKEHFEIQHYGSLSQDEERYRLVAVKTSNWDPAKPCVLVTGGVHGYEKSGVQGAIRFLQTAAQGCSEEFNIVVIPCVSPWGYETIQRWNCKACDPNRSFSPGKAAENKGLFSAGHATEEGAAVIAFLGSLGVEQWLCHLDLHETTNSDTKEFLPATAARDGIEHVLKVIPDGFYLVADEDVCKETAQREWLTAMIDAVREVTHIAPADEKGEIIGLPLLQEGVCVLPSSIGGSKGLGLSMGLTDAPYRATTEVYPDSPNATEELSIQAQLACICAALGHITRAQR